MTMTDFNKEQGDFLEGVWRKVKYMEYIKAEEETVKKRQQLLRTRKIKIVVSLSLIVLLVITPTLFMAGINMGTIFLFGFLVMCASSFYENLGEIDFIWRVRHGNKN